MPQAKLLPRAFYSRETLTVARELIGARLVRVENGVRIAGIIVETEGYLGEEDLACHARAGRTARTEPMYGPPGHAFVYFTYGNHWMLNPVTRPVGEPEAVLLRAILPTEGIEIIEKRRGKQPRKRWTDGPGKLTQALGITKEHNKVDLTSRAGNLFIEEGIAVPDKYVTTTPRIGLNTTPEPWFSKPWRYLATLPLEWFEAQDI
jgi:DNA-3-methyladenine glycosylase